ncbi:MAG: Gfo/Idh/MocA family oxidoreductase, partial [Flavitalea sp.]
MIHRRNFIKGTAATIALAGIDLSGFASFAPPKKYRVAVIGTGWYGKSDLFRLMQVADIELVGLSDPDSKQLREADEIIRKRHPKSKPALYKDYREMLQKQKPEI